MINDDGVDDGLAVSAPRLQPSQMELDAREAVIAKVKQPISPERLAELAALRKQPKPAPELPAVLTPEQIAAELKKVDAELRNNGFSNAQTARPHRNRVD